jgi:hypothetical protein
MDNHFDSPGVKTDCSGIKPVFLEHRQIKPQELVPHRGSSADPMPSLLIRTTVEELLAFSSAELIITKPDLYSFMGRTWIALTTSVTLSPTFKPISFTDSVVKTEAIP